nr:MAG TPA: hypothetical protein [Caudoviricetes sp.]
MRRSSGRFTRFLKPVRYTPPAHITYVFLKNL